MIFQATCKLGVEALVATELRKLGIEPVSVDSAKIRFEGDYLTMARACLWLRTAERVLLEVGRFEAHTFTDLFEGVKALDWKQYLAKDAFIHVVGKSAKSDLFSVKDCQSITKKAIVENLKAAYHTTLLPETGAEILVEGGMFKRSTAGSGTVFASRKCAAVGDEFRYPDDPGTDQQFWNCGNGSLCSSSED